MFSARPAEENTTAQVQQAAKPGSQPGNKKIFWDTTGAVFASGD